MYIWVWKLVWAGGEWKDAEKNGGMTFMGKTVKGLTRGIMSIQNGIMYGKKAKY